MFWCCCGSERDATSSAEIVHVPVESHKGNVAPPSDDVTTATPPQSIGNSAGPRGSVAENKTENAGIERAPIKGGVFKPPQKREEVPAPVPMTLPKSDKARRTSVPQEADLSSGAYLVYEKDTNSVYVQWSRVPVDGALAWLKPLVQVPGHKYNVNKGKEIITKQANDPEKYFRAWVTFLKITREFPSKCMLLENFEATGAPQVRVIMLEFSLDSAGKTFTTEMSSYGLLYDLLKNVKAVAVVPSASTLIPIGEQMDSKVFIQRGSGEGAAELLESLNA
ncbi:hypothetical protein TGRUB_255420 [Toxoplasma gondii RUB]|uniref:Immune mapped protein 2 N-terminal domain-containing protein n=11 Tax=Toxoplasma gondii TaxID=5811 RepID=S7WAV9_TOXGG|nr:hypothetical protein TGGT1_255420 [Toxoplasma gondii GT1]KAF4641541.1 hypothetical protein TGRH88_073510 [Toxoplasma gondii]KFG30037.1 hypothetical protein TGDOM2_255420 [Toxoplasma gondii GAB2-2007-GAL-DOM2]KFG36987.1 hypothetical protein TGFOU_255420 [Toxoplasma gondii FOU]KFG50571.1 hypothetical protein TGP89_255420 [Toxoplasma gondii p89]KFG57571.1 hypothetical protein TGRUB_255420 [Toxoplasma gondii RUB]KFH02729.1 hypothetical protein TGMAS_255420 [Toxoplasma gondii MAS]KFH02946.1 hy